MQMLIDSEAGPRVRSEGRVEAGRKTRLKGRSWEDAEQTEEFSGGGSRQVANDGKSRGPNDLLCQRQGTHVSTSLQRHTGPGSHQAREAEGM